MNKENVRELLEYMMYEEFPTFNDAIKYLENNGLKITRHNEEKKVIFFKDKNGTEYFVEVYPLIVITEYGFDEVFQTTNYGYKQDYRR